MSEETNNQMSPALQEAAERLLAPDSPTVKEALAVGWEGGDMPTSSVQDVDPGASVEAPTPQDDGPKAEDIRRPDEAPTSTTEAPQEPSVSRRMLSLKKRERDLERREKLLAEKENTQTQQTTTPTIDSYTRGS